MTGDPSTEGAANDRDRPRPQYGEYATPQEQAKIIAESLPPVSPLLAPSSGAGPAVPVASLGTASGPGFRAARRLPRGRPRRWDLIVSAVLLGYATVNVIAQLVSRDTLATVITQFFLTQGIGTYTPTALTTALGNVLNVVTLALFVATAALTAWMLRRGRIAFWIPIVGGVVAAVVAVVFVAVLLQGDPAFLAYMNGLRK